MHEEGSGPLADLLRRAGLGDVSPTVLRGAAVVCVVLIAFAVWRFAPGLLGEGAPDAGAGAGGGAGVAGVAGEASAAAPVAAPSPSTSSGPAPELVVHIAGAVRHPGVYHLEQGDRVCDLVSLAGGLLGTAAPAAVNLARPLADGEQIVVPTQEEAAQGAVAGGAGAGGAGGVAGAAGGGGATGAGGGGGPGGGGVVDINHAGVGELDALPGVGPATAQKIVDDRTTNGPFRSPEDLMRVPGIGQKKFEQLKARITAR